MAKLLQTIFSYFKKTVRFIILGVITSLWLLQFTFVVAAPIEQGQNVVVISSPDSNSTIQGKVAIIGSADYPSFQFYIVEFSPESTAGQWHFIGDGQKPVLNDTLTTWDTTAIPDGNYTLRLRVVRLDGNYSEAFSEHLVVSNSKPLPTNTPLITATIALTKPNVTESPPPTPLAATATITPTAVRIDLPVVETATPRPTAVATVIPLPDPAQKETLIPEIKGFALDPLRDACLYGAGVMLTVFLLFGFLSTLRFFIQSFIDRRRSH